MGQKSPLFPYCFLPADTNTNMCNNYNRYNNHPPAYHVSDYDRVRDGWRGLQFCVYNQLSGTRQIAGNCAKNDRTWFGDSNHYMYLFGSKGILWIQKLFWQPSRAVTWQRFCMILILTWDIGKGCLENEQIWHYLKENDLYDQIDLCFETILVLYIKSY